MGERTDFNDWAGRTTYGHGRDALERTVGEVANVFYGGNRNHTEWVFLRVYRDNDSFFRDEIIRNWQSISPPKNGNGNQG